MPSPRIAIVGAGLAGLSCARTLLAAGAEVTLFDKGRVPGGRLATRRVEAAGARLQFDHGAQYLTARGEGFATLLRQAGAAPWSQPGWRVGVPGMSALPRALAAGMAVVPGRPVTALEEGPGGWTLRLGDMAAGPFRAVAVTVPAPQAVPLVGPHWPALAARLGGVVMAPCWTLMAGFAARLPLPDQQRPPGDATGSGATGHGALGPGATGQDMTGPGATGAGAIGSGLPGSGALGPGAIGWAARDSSKPGREAGTECWVVQASPAWSRTHLEAAPEAVAAALLGALAGLAGAALPGMVHAAAHRWRHSLVEVPLGEPCLWDGGRRLGLAGDWSLAGRAEAAFESGTALARAVLAG